MKKELERRLEKLEYFFEKEWSFYPPFVMGENLAELGKTLIKIAKDIDKEINKNKKRERR